MKGVYHILYGIVLLFLLQGCEEAYELDQPYQAKLVVNGLFQAEKPWNIEVSQSVNILKPTNTKLLIDDADVVITDLMDGSSYVLNYDYAKECYTHLSYTPLSGHRYEITVDHNNYDGIEATGYCPKNPTIRFGAVEEIVENEIQGVRVNFELIQSSIEDNFYLWDITPIESDSRINGSISDYHDNPNVLFDEIGTSVLNTSGDYSTTFKVESSSYFFEGIDLHGFVKSETEYESSSNKVLFDKDNTSIQELLMNGGGGTTKEEGDGSSDKDKYSLHIISLSEEIYHYYNSIVEYNKKRPTISSLQTIQKIDSNIEGGYGVFAGINNQTITFR